MHACSVQNSRHYSRPLSSGLGLGDWATPGIKNIIKLRAPLENQLLRQPSWGRTDPGSRNLPILICRTSFEKSSKTCVGLHYFFMFNIDTIWNKPSLAIDRLDSLGVPVSKGVAIYLKTLVCYEEDNKRRAGRSLWHLSVNQYKHEHVRE